MRMVENKRTVKASPGRPVGSAFCVCGLLPKPRSEPARSTQVRWPACVGAVNRDHSMNLNITNIRSDTRILNFWVENRILYLVVDAPHCQPGDPPEVVAEALLDWVPLGNA